MEISNLPTREGREKRDIKRCADGEEVYSAGSNISDVVELRLECEAAYYVIMGHLSGLESGGAAAGEYHLSTSVLAVFLKYNENIPRQEGRMVFVELVTRYFLIISILSGTTVWNVSSQNKEVLLQKLYQ